MRAAHWRYSVQIPGAVSLSFHAERAELPESATLTVTASGKVYTYTAQDVHRGEMWSRVARGDSLSFELTLATMDRNRLRLDIATFQAGYRGLGGDVPNNRHYDALRLKTQAVAAATTSCLENWACQTTAANAGRVRQPSRFSSATLFNARARSLTTFVATALLMCSPRATARTAIRMAARRAQLEASACTGTR